MRAHNTRRKTKSLTLGARLHASSKLHLDWFDTAARPIVRFPIASFVCFLFDLTQLREGVYLIRRRLDTGCECMCVCVVYYIL